ncbi:putative serine/threonine protein kinase ENV7 Ecym_2153 [Eremothecium cymbalariae DBVPG|uniref:non-specific serine/threonine protein kinase n=1 Tax=Eremothecium cymbalariae (strain CBS 270.75 / DBVPG 7215 / KCTC 17166 / NRRL Y-17582) TaxID=931890 RepID=G8JNI9_ERECY|nr:Hypothetical protein Ecym_2153 [Eremothecium cymbalariae DBVPG\
MVSPFEVLCGCCSPCGFWFDGVRISINGKSYLVTTLLREGELTALYQVKCPKRSHSGGVYALKKVTCPIGRADFVTRAMTEISNYQRFNSPYITNILDFQVAQHDNGTKIIYMLLPYFPAGSLQDLINNMIIRGDSLSESRVVRLMLDICRGVRCMHEPSESDFRDPYDVAYFDAASLRYSDETHLLVDAMELDLLSPPLTNSEPSAYVHCGLNPENIMLSSEGLPVIYNMASCVRAPLELTSNSKLLGLQEWLNENSCLPYTCPELLDLHPNTSITNRCDIWSLGCICYALMYSISSFAREQQLCGTPIKHSISTGNFSFPDEPRYSQSLKRIVQRCLVIDPHKRPDIYETLAQFQELLDTS